MMVYLLMGLWWVITRQIGRIMVDLWMEWKFLKKIAWLNYYDYWIHAIQKKSRSFTSYRAKRFARRFIEVVPSLSSQLVYRVATSPTEFNRIRWSTSEVLRNFEAFLIRTDSSQTLIGLHQDPPESEKHFWPIRQISESWIAQIYAIGFGSSPIGLRFKMKC